MLVKRVPPNFKQPRTEMRTIANLPRLPIYRKHHLLAEVFTQIRPATVRAEEGHELRREHEEYFGEGLVVWRFKKVVGHSKFPARPIICGFRIDHAELSSS